MLASKPLSHAALVGAAALVFAACGGDDAPAATTAATVNGTEIAASDVEGLTEILLENPQTQQQLETADEDQVMGQLRADALSQLIFEVILRDGAEELGVEITQDDIDETLAEIAVQFGGDVDSMYEQLEEQGLDRDEVDRQVEFVALQDAVMTELGGDVSDEDVAEAYEEGTPARHIIVQEEAEATEAYERIEAGEDFAAVAEETSTDGTAAQGGDLGFVQPGTTVPEFEEALFALDEGELVGPVQTDFGFHVIQRLEKPDLAEVEDELRAQLEQQSMQESQASFQEFIMERLQAAEVEVDPEYGTWNAEFGQVVPEEPVQPEQPLPEEFDNPGNPEETD